MIWNSLKIVTGSESPIVVVLRYELYNTQSIGRYHNNNFNMIFRVIITRINFLFVGFALSVGQFSYYENNAITRGAIFIIYREISKTRPFLRFRKVTSTY
jgi:hypothetical protein